MSRSEGLRASVTGTVRTLAVVLGDQLDHDSAALRGLDPDRDAVLMMEVEDESRHVPSHKQRTVLFLSAMRHFALELMDRGLRVRYVRLDMPGNSQSFDGEVRRAAELLSPERVVLVRPGEHRVTAMAEAWAEDLDAEVDILEDDHFLCSRERFGAWAEGRKELTLEYFYREMRRELGVLLTEEGKPVGAAWNFDKDNRERFKVTPRPPTPYRARPDEVTREVMALVERRMGDLPGRLESFHWPVTRAEALRALRKFIDERLPRFGKYQDAMWTEQRVLYHSAISPALNLKLLRPREVYEAAVEAHEAGKAPLNSVEGFVRQVIGWREFIRGVYEFEGENYGDRNSLGQEGALPEFYWTGETDMHCLADSLGQVLDEGYGHHIQRLMVTGNFALISGVSPRAITDWYLGMYVDAVDWVTTPNTLGMAMHADGREDGKGVVGTKPYAASGKYIQRMSNYCEHCRYDPGKREGEDACPFGVFYWDFLIRNRERFAKNQRMAMILKNVDRIDKDTRTALTVSAKSLRRKFGIGPIGKG